MKRYVTSAVVTPVLAALALLPTTAATLAANPSFDCSKVEAGSIEELICKDDELSALDRKMASVYAQAVKKAVDEHPPVLKAGQRGWIKGRNDCWKSDDKKRCVQQSYQNRIAELQARYRLIPATATVRYVCDGNPAKEVIATFFPTEPATAVAEFGDQTSLMYQQRAASGVRYQGQNETLWEHQGKARITWGNGSPEMSCILMR